MPNMLQVKEAIIVGLKEEIEKLTQESIEWRTKFIGNEVLNEDLEDDNKNLKEEIEKYKTEIANYNETIKELYEENEKLKQNNNEGLKKENAELKEKLSAISNIIGGGKMYWGPDIEIEEKPQDPTKLQSIIRGWLFRKHMKCCVCYEKTFKKLRCCAGYLCDNCRDQCQDRRCPLCRVVMPRPQLPLFLTPRSNEQLLLRTIMTDINSYNAELIVYPSPHHPQRINEDHETAVRYSQLGFNDVPEEYRLNTLLNDNNWARRVLNFMVRWNFYNTITNIMRDTRYFFGNNTFFIGLENDIKLKILNLTQRPSDWSKDNSPTILRTITQRVYPTFSRGPLGTSRGIPMEVFARNPDMTGNSNTARLDRVWWKIMNKAQQFQRTIQGETQNWKYIMLKQGQKYIHCIMRLADEFVDERLMPWQAENIFDMSDSDSDSDSEM